MKHKLPPKKWSWLLVLVGFSLVWPPSVLAAEDAPDSPKIQNAGDPAESLATQPADVPDDLAQTEEGEELLLFEDMPVVISASRTETKIDWLSVPTSIVTDQDIHYSGLTNIPEILQFTPGVDVRRIDRNRYAVGIQGPYDVTSDKVLTLIDGRNAYSQYWGGAEYFRYPVLMEDIKRIEVVRGPTGSAWGANALTGAINVITKDPEDCLGYLASTQWDHFGDTYNQMRWADEQGKLSWRISAGYKGLKSSDRAGAGDYKTRVPGISPLIGFDGFHARDFNRTMIFDTKFVYRPFEKTKLSAGAAYSHVETGNFEAFAYYPQGNVRYETTRLFTRIDQEFSKDVTGYLQWFANLENTSWAHHFGDTVAENDIEGQLNFKLGKHNLSTGGNVRLLNIREKLPNDPQAIQILQAPFKEQWAGAFIIDRWQVTDRLVLEGQFRGDWYSETQLDWSGRAAAMYALDKEKRHIARLSAAKAFRAPTAARRHMFVTSVPLPSPPLPPNLFGVNIIPLETMRNEEIWSLEAGYTGHLAKGLTFKADGYIQKCDDLIGSRRTPDPLGLGRVLVNLDNIDDALAWGGTTELTYKNKIGEISAWYSYSVFQLAEGQWEQDVLASLPAMHKTGLTGRLFLPDDWTLNGNFRYSTGSVLRTVVEGPWRSSETYRLDLTVSKKVFKDHGEIMIGVADLLNKNDPAEFDYASMTRHDTPGRMFFVRFQLNF